MTDKEKEQQEMRKKQRYEREKKICTLAHSVAEQIVAFENITYEESFWVLERAKRIIKKSMGSHRAEIEPEIRDCWGTVIGMSGTNAPDTKQ